jgi:predicted dehydrogenase
VGCGFIAAKHAQALSNMPGCRLVAVYDVDNMAAEKLARSTGVQIYRSYDDLLADPGVDVVNLCTPGSLHAVLGIKAASHGKHVLVEKPMAVTLEDADALIEACDRAGVVLVTAHQNRFKGPVRALKTALEQEKMGRISHGSVVLRWNRNMDYYLQKPWRADASQGGGVLLNQAIHNIDLLQWMLGPVNTVYGLASSATPSLKAEESAVAVLKFASGVLGIIEACSSVYPVNLEETLSIFGDNGTVILSGTSIGQVKKWQFAVNISKPPDHVVNPTDPGGYRPLLEDMVQCIKTGRKPLVDGWEGRKCLEIIQAIKRSNRTGLPVNLPLFKDSKVNN